MKMMMMMMTCCNHQQLCVTTSRKLDLRLSHDVIPVWLLGAYTFLRRCLAKDVVAIVSVRPIGYIES